MKNRTKNQPWMLLTIAAFAATLIYFTLLSLDLLDSAILWRISNEEVLYYELSDGIAGILFMLSVFCIVSPASFLISYFFTSFIPPVNKAMGAQGNAFTDKKLRHSFYTILKVQKVALIIFLPIVFLTSQNYYFMTPTGIHINKTFSTQEQVYQWGDIIKIERSIHTSGGNGNRNARSSRKLSYAYNLLLPDDNKVDIMQQNLHEFFHSYKNIKPYLDNLTVEKTIKVTERGRKRWQILDSEHKESLEDLMFN